MKQKSLKIISLLLSVIFTISFFGVFSSAVLSGDINLNGKIEAGDARTVLRASVGLEKLTDTEFSLADTDSDGKITASDARMILRMSVGLEEIKEIADSENEGYFEIHFIDVGQADCSLIICDDETLLIDGGNVGDGNLIIEYLSDMHIEMLDYVICTHAHEDHVGGLSQVLDTFTVTDEIFAPKTGAESKCYQNFVTSAENQQKTLSVPEIGYTFTLGESTVEFIGPVTEDYSDINNTSLVTKITYGENTFLFTGDMEREAEADILEAGADISADVLKVGHHGSENSTSYPFLREIMPEIAVISVGEGNKYGHPTEEALSRLRDADVKVYRTDMQGHIKITSDGKTLTVTTERNQTAETNPTNPVKPDETPTVNGEYIGNINSKKLHLPTCSSLPKEENRIYFATRETAINAGYTPCSRCKP